MKTYRGTTRTVIVIPCLGIAIKIAQIDFLLGLKRLFIEPIIEHNRRLFINQLRWDSGAEDSFRRAWFRGTTANWREFWFYLNTRHPLLQPTYFTLFGIFNVQKIASEPLVTKSDSYYQFKILSKILEGEHIADNPDNFCLEHGRLKILDYGDPEVRRAVLTDGDSLLKFDPNWDYEEYKKSRPDRYPLTAAKNKREN